MGGIYDRHAVVERTSPDAAGGRRMGRRLLDQPPGDRPTAILCYNDQVAMGVYQAAEAVGLEVPRDCSVVGVDDLEVISAALDPGLTTMALPHLEMGRRGMAALLERIAGAGAGAARMSRGRCCSRANSSSAVRSRRRGGSWAG